MGVLALGKKAKNIKTKNKKTSPPPNSRGRFSLMLAVAGTALIILLAVAKKDYAGLPMQLAGWFSGVALAWLALGLINRKK